MTIIPLHTSKSRHITGRKCKRRRYYSNVLGGHGITPVTDAEPLQIGKIWHTGVERILHGEDYAKVAKECAATIASTLKSNTVRMWGEEDPNLEWSRWMEGMLYACGKYILPSILGEYEVVDVELETILRLNQLPEVIAMAKGLGREDLLDQPVELIGVPDLLLRRKRDKTYWYWEWKTTGWADPRWLRQWDKDIQLQGAATAIAATKGHTIEGCVVQGVWKGTKRDGHMVHPLVYAYADAPGIDGFRHFWTPSYGKGLSKTSTEEFEGGVTGWVDELYVTNQEAILNLFPRTLPVAINNKLVDAYFRQLWWEEVGFGQSNQLQLTIEDHAAWLDAFYPQSFWECESFGKCAYLDCCWNQEVEQDPVGSGLYQLKENRYGAEGDDHTSDGAAT